MDAERAAWLARTTETAFDAAQPICDPHHHLWDHPGDRYLLDELLADTGAGHNVVETVFVECGSAYRTGGPPELAPVGETEFVAAAAAQSEQRRDAHGGAVIAGIVAFADLRLGAAVAEVLEAHRAAGGRRVVGVRHATAWDADPRVRNHRTDPKPELARDPAFQEGVRTLGRFGLTYDIWCYHPQLAEVVELAQAAPETTVVVDHLGGPLGVGPYAGRHADVLAACRGPLEALARLDNVRLKLGGIGMTIMGQRWHRREAPPTSTELAAVWAPHIHWCIERFGPNRCMFESNFPPDRASCSYTVLWNAFQRIAAGAGPAERDRLFRGTAVEVYGLAAG
ncbi:MAG: amidohydrolase family protein [Acidimicrobiales bacterium]